MDRVLQPMRQQLLYPARQHLRFIIHPHPPWQKDKRLNWTPHGLPPATPTAVRQRRRRPPPATGTGDTPARKAIDTRKLAASRFGPDPKELPMLGIVIPAHDEELLIEACVRAAKRAAEDPRLRGESVVVMVVADSCSDGTVEVAEGSGAATMSIDARNVGHARALGAQALLAQGARWLAFTDADTQVAPQWLADQLSLDADAVCGTVDVVDWSPHGAHAELLRHHFSQTYFDVEGHRHVHGANLGVSAEAYVRAGGFQQLACSEDEALVQALQASGARIAWSAKPRVTTSARRQARAPGGFADALLAAVAVRLKAAQPLTTSASVSVST